MATKRGYEHDAPVDGSWFDDYVKEFTSAGLSATIRFTGSNLPEDKITCATRDLTFRSGYRTLSLSSVPPVLLAECYADYTALAALGAFDPNWGTRPSWSDHVRGHGSGRGLTQVLPEPSAGDTGAIIG